MLERLEAEVARISGEHDPEALKLMVMYHFASSLMDAWGRANTVSMEDQITMLARAVRAFGDVHGITLDKRIAASTAIKSVARASRE